MLTLSTGNKFWLFINVNLILKLQCPALPLGSGQKSLYLSWQVSLNSNCEKWCWGRYTFLSRKLSFFVQINLFLPWPDPGSWFPAYWSDSAATCTGSCLCSPIRHPYPGKCIPALAWDTQLNFPPPSGLGHAPYNMLCCRALLPSMFLPYVFYFSRGIFPTIPLLPFLTANPYK